MTKRGSLLIQSQKFFLRLQLLLSHLLQEPIYKFAFKDLPHVQ